MFHQEISIPTFYKKAEDQKNMVTWPANLICLHTLDNFSSKTPSLSPFACKIAKKMCLQVTMHLLLLIMSV